MSFKRKSDGLDREKKIHKVKTNKNVIDKHKNVLYNIASSKRISEDDDFDDELDYAYVSNKNRQR